MPRISTFYGIVIAIYYDDHAPPHFRAIYSGGEAVISINNLDLLAGGLSRRARVLVLEWASARSSGAGGAIGGPGAGGETGA